MVKFRTLLIDPPWSYRNVRTGGSMNSGSAQKYKVMSLDDIISMPVADICEKDSCLFLWATTPLLPDCLHVMREWGFTYKTAIYWRKIMSLGMGYWFRGQVELCLFGIRGKVPAFRLQKCNFIQTKALGHSEKPVELYELIEPVVPEPRAELFARSKRDGWSCWGDEIESDFEFPLTT